MKTTWALSLSWLGFCFLSPGAIAQTIIPANDGTATLVMPNGKTLNITGGMLSGDGRNLFHSFQEFGLSAQQIANFIANPQIQNILGRVTGGNPSIINGLIQVSGGQPNLFLMNPSGIVFGPNASLNVPASFVATTATGIGFAGGQFNAYGANNYTALTGNPNTFLFQGFEPGTIINTGDLAVNSGQGISLVAGTVINTGSITAPGGEITLSAVPGSSLVRISQKGQVLSLEVPLPHDAQGNSIPFQPTDLPALLTGSGLETGLSVTPTGTVEVTATGTPIPSNSGTAIVSGQVTAANNNGVGGKIQATGTQVGLIKADINTSGNNGGGTVLIGGDYQGKGTIPNAQNTYVSSDSVVRANAIDQGDGGKVVVWADGNTQFKGIIEAKGGVNGGNGGLAEVSGKQNLAFQGQADLTAVQGQAGTLLLDPENITIVSEASGTNDAQLPNIPFTQDAGVDYTISESALEGLAGTANVQLEAANNITINPLSDGTLTFQSGTGSITFIANADNAGGGDFSMNTSDTILTSGRNLTIQGNNITVGNIQSGGSTTGGNITLQATGNNQISGGIVTSGGNFLASGTDIITTNTIDTNNFSTGTGGDVTSNATANNQIGGSVSTGGGIFTASGANIITLSGSFIDTDGGNVNLQAVGDIQLGGSIYAYFGGDVTISGANITTLNTFYLDTDPDSTDQTGGNVNLTASGNVQLDGYLTLHDGGDLTIQGTNITTLDNSSLSTAGFSTGIAGNINLQALDNIQLGGSIATNGGNFTATGGDIAITNSVNTSNFSTGAIGGSVNLTGMNITVTPLASSFSPAIQTGGGSVNATATNNLTINSSPTGTTIDTSNFSTGTTGGNVTLNATGSNQIAGQVSTGGGNFTATGGDIAITSYLGTEGGNVNLQATGNNQISGSINTNGGSFTATGANITTTNYIDTNNYNGSIGGNINLQATGANQVGGFIATGGGGFGASGANLTILDNADISTVSFYNGGVGGNINLRTTGSNQIGGSIDTTGGSVTATGADITTTGIIDTYDSNYNGGVGGTINLQATGAIQIVDAINTGGGSFNANANNITSVSNSSINTNSYSTGIKGGDVNFQSSGNIQLAGTIETSGGSFTANGANLNIAEVNTSTGSNGLDGGAITLTATGNIQTGNLFSYTTANRGDVFSRGGDISLNAGGTIDTTTGKGIIIVQDGTSQLQVPAIASGSSTGNGGNVSLVAGGDIKAPFIGTGSLSSGNAGNINITSQNGAIDATQNLSWNGESQVFGGLVSASVYGNGGNVTLSAPGNIQTGVIATGNIGGPVRPGDVTITSQNGSINTAIGANINSVSTEFLASLGVPDQYLAEASQLQVGLGIFTFSKDTNGGNVTLNAQGDITTSNIITGSLSGNGGNISLISQNGSIDTSSGILFQGLNATTLEDLGASANLAKLGAYLSDNKIGGLITFSVYGSGGDITLNAPNGITTNYLVANSYTQNGGNISLNSSNGSIKIGGLLANQINPLTFDSASDTLTLEDWNAIGWLFSQGSLSTRGGTDGGNITLIATDEIETVTINAQGGDQGTGGNVEVRAGTNFRVTGTFSDRNNILSSIATAAGQGGGDITIQTGNVPFIVGNASVNGTAGAITTGDFTINSGEYFFTTQVGNIGLILGEPPVNPPITPPVFPPITPPVFPPITPPVLPPITPPVFPSSPQLNAVLQTPPLPPAPSLAIASSSLSITKIPQVQEILEEISEKTGKKPALVYVQFVAPTTSSAPFDDQQFTQRESELISEYQTVLTPKLNRVRPTLAVPSQSDYLLEITVIAQNENPLRIVVPGVTRAKIIGKAMRFRSQITNQENNYLDNASQLYQWLIAPIEGELQAQKIDSLLFFLPDGLRTLPLTALYDNATQQFAVEKSFSIGTAPSLNLVDYRYRNLNDAPVLAFGATDFPDQQQNALPGVGVELPLVRSIKGGEFFLNQDFNLQMIEAQRRENPLPIVHLATHANFLKDFPRKSYIQLYNKKLELPSWANLDLNLPATDLLVISACNTAVGNSAVELGFGGMAVQAGVKTALASLWPVGDIGTVGLMDGFYRNLKMKTTKAEALQSVQKAMLKGDYRWENKRLTTPDDNVDFSDLENLPNSINLQHPYYWSSFMMIGSPW
jgi:filamentous hemagglutinin family protein